jgi:phage shock protein A
MRFPETTRCGSDAHESAVARLDAAREKRAVLSATAEAAQGTPAQPGADRDLALASDDESARSAWLAWVELGH